MVSFAKKNIYTLRDKHITINVICLIKVGLYFRRRQAPHTPPHDAPVRSISRRVPIGLNLRKRRCKKYKPTRV